MLFYSFVTQEQRRAFGGSEFLEIQFCRLPSNASIQQLVAISNIHNWQNDSLYVQDENLFYREYAPILNFGVYNNLERGPVDIYGINYYAPAHTDHIIELFSQRKPYEYQIFTEWLCQSKQYNGFYILGL